MQKELLPSKWTFAAGLLLAFPAVYFVVANVLNSELGLNWLYKPIAPIFDKPANKHFGWNINLLIVFGPLLAILLNAWSLLHIRFDKSVEYFRVEINIKRKWWNLALLIVAVGTMLCLGTYLFFENLASTRAVN